MQDKLKDKSDLELYEMLGKGRSEARAAFDELYSRYSARIYTYCRKILMNNEAAEDVFQETFTKLYTHSQNGNKVNNVSGFLLAIARNLCLNEKNKKGGNNISLDDIQLKYFDKSYESKEINQILHLAIDALPEQFREVIIMKEFMDMTYQEIADAINQTMPAVRIRIFRAKQKLREIMTPYIKDLQE